MPQFLIEAPVGLADEAKAEMMQEISAALDDAYDIPDVRVWLREYAAVDVAHDGKVGAAPIRPLCFLHAPALELDAKRALVGKLQGAIADAYDGIADTAQTLMLMDHRPLEDAAWGGRLLADIPEFVEHVAR
jgi:hypothetical protein